MTNPLVERRLREFVDRDREMSAFIGMLTSADRPIMVVWGESGIGKTSLLMRIIHECSARRLRKAEVVWKDTNPHDYLAVMRKIRDDLGAEHFPAFTDLVNFYHETGYQPKLQLTLALQGSTIRVGENMQVERSTVGDIAAVVIKDSMFQFPRTDLSVPESERRSRLTERFIKELQAASRDETVIVLLDAVEKMSADTERWVWDELLDAVRNGLLPNLRFVLCGQRPPPADRDWQAFITAADLKPLGRTDVNAYLKKRVDDLDDASLENLSTMILGVTKGTPANVANAVDAFLQLRISQPA